MENDTPLLQRPEMLNPYRRAASLFKQRFVWDLNPQAWCSRKKLKYIRNKYSGKKAIVLCNGPSLLKVDFDMLSKSEVFTFGLNKINLLFDKVKFRPSCIVAVNQYVIQQNRCFYNESNIPLFLDSAAYKIGVKPKESLTYLHSSNMRGEFARDCSFSIFVGNTVTYVALQLAFHMGFSEVSLVGCDHNFSANGPSNKTVIAEKQDLDHFDPNYFSNGVKWQLPDLFESEVAYKIAKDFYEKSGKRLLNSTSGGCLEVFPRISLDEFLSFD